MSLESAGHWSVRLMQHPRMLNLPTVCHLHRMCNSFVFKLNFQIITQLSLTDVFPGKVQKCSSYSNEHITL